MISSTLYLLVHPLGVQSRLDERFEHPLINFSKIIMKDHPLDVKLTGNFLMEFRLFFFFFKKVSRG